MGSSFRTRLLEEIDRDNAEATMLKAIETVNRLHKTSLKKAEKMESLVKGYTLALVQMADKIANEQGKRLVEDTKNKSNKVLGMMTLIFLLSCLACVLSIIMVYL